jgi:hypothetical protein
VTELRVEGCGEKVALADEDREVVAGGQGFDLGAGAGDAGGADEDHLEWAAGEFRGGGEDGGVQLAPVGIAFDGDVEGGEGDLGGILDVIGEEDGSSAGSEGGDGTDEGREGVEEAVALEKFEHGGGFAAGDDEAVDTGVAVGGEELVGGSDESGGDAEGGEGLGMGLIGSLEGQDAQDGCGMLMCWLLCHEPLNGKTCLLNYKRLDHLVISRVTLFMEELMGSWFERPFSFEAGYGLCPADQLLRFPSQRLLQSVDEGAFEGSLCVLPVR